MISGVPGISRDVGPSGVLISLVVVGVLASGCLGDSASKEPVATDQVRIPGAWVFEPEVIAVAPNTTVTWQNDGGQAHTVTFEALTFDETIEPGARLEHTFTEPGVYEYVCRFHPPDMVGQVHVGMAESETGATEET